MSRELAHLALPDARLIVECLPTSLGHFGADDVQLLATGLLGRRTDVSLRLQYTEGDPGFARNGFTTLSGMSQGRLALTRLLAMTVQYMYYHYEFGPEAILPADMSRRFNRHALRVGFDLWLPLHR